MLYEVNQYCSAKALPDSKAPLRACQLRSEPWSQLAR